jgi:hypothetical protein
MKYEINIEIERTTIIGNNSPNTSNVENNNEAIEVEAKEIKQTNCGLPPKLQGDNNNEK